MMLMKRFYLFIFLLVMFIQSLLGCGGHTPVVLEDCQVTLTTNRLKNEVDFLGAKLHDAIQNKVVIYNKSKFSLRLSLTLLQNKDNVFRLLNAPKRSFLLPAKNTKELKIQFLTHKTGHFVSYIEVKWEFESQESCHSIVKKPLKIKLYQEVKKPSIRLECGQELNFGRVPFGQKTTKRCNIMNNNDYSIKVVSINYLAQKGLTNAFSWNTDLFSTKIPAHSQRSLIVSFMSESSKQSEGILTLNIQSENFSELLQLKLLLKGEGIKVLGCKLAVSPELLHFTSKGDKKITIHNQGDRSCYLDDISLDSTTDKAFSLSPIGKNLILKPDQKLVITVYFSTQDNFSHRGNLLIKSSDSKLRDIPLEGKIAKDCELKIDLASLNFQSVLIGESKSAIFKVRNIGDHSCRIRGIEKKDIFPLNHGAFRISHSLKLPMILKSNEYLIISVVFAPKIKEGTHTSKLIFTLEQSKKEFSMVGLAQKSCIAVFPKYIDFPQVQLNCVAQSQKIKIYHLKVAGCPANIKIMNIHLSQNTKNFKLNQMSFPLILQKGQPIELTVSYQPHNLSVNLERLEITTNIMNHPSLIIPLLGAGSNQGIQDTFKIKKQLALDLLFVVDNSPATLDLHAKMKKYFLPFIQQKLKNIDYHIATITADITSHQGSNYNRPNVGCFWGREKIITPKSQYINNLFSLGSSGYSDIFLLESMYRALSLPNIQDPQCNKGFYRKDAMLAIIFATEQFDVSKRTLTFYQDFIKNLKGQRYKDLLHISSIAAFAPNYNKMLIKITNYFSGIHLNYKDKDWTPLTTGLSSFIDIHYSRFMLTQEPISSSIKVTVNNKIIPQNAQNGWKYNQSINTIHFAKSVIPTPNSTVVISYKRVCHP